MYRIQDEANLYRASKLDAASKITKLDGPGGGSIISLVDPEGFPVALVHGIAPTETGDMPQKIIYNTESEKPRQREFSRFQPGPAAVHKLGELFFFLPTFN